MINKLFFFNDQVVNLKNNKKYVCYSEEIWIRVGSAKLTIKCPIYQGASIIDHNMLRFHVSFRSVY